MKTVKAGHLEIGAGIPKIAVPIMASSGEELLAKAELIRDSGADLIEIRADYWTGTPEEAAEAYRALRDRKLLPLLVTWRSAAEGGKGLIDDSCYESVLMRFIERNSVDLLDVEYEQPGRERIMEACRARGIPVVCSWHEYRNTPASPAVWNRICAMAECGADIVKCAMMPTNDMDAVRLLCLGARARRELQVPSVVIAMGERGRATRTSGEIYGSAFTFACLPGEASAPGQLSVEVLRGKLNGIHERFSGGRHIFLTGFMGVGKTTIASELSRMTGRPCIEMDRMIEEQEGRRIQDIFSSDGEGYFRDTETRLLAYLYKRKPAVVSCGGGAVLRPENRILMKALGTVVLLTARPETLLTRLQESDEVRPNIAGLMSEEGISALLAKREDAYLAAADHVIPTDGLSPVSVCERIIDAVGADGAPEGGERE